MAGIRWTKNEDEFLKGNYAHGEKEELCKALPLRTWDAIKIRAEKLSIKRLLIPQRASNLSPLLEDTPEAFYWIGFLLADGCINFKTWRLLVHLALKDLSHLEKLAKFINVSKLAKSKHGVRLSAQDKTVVPRIVSKFDFRKAKTYNPPTLPLYHEHFLSLIIGFIDGDGNIHKVHRREDAAIRIKVHSSWLATLRSFDAYVYSRFELTDGKSDERVKINKQGYTELNWCDSRVVQRLKKYTLAHNLPVLERKWCLIDETRPIRSETAAYKKSKVIDLWRQGIPGSVIAESTGFGRPGVYKIIRQYKESLNERTRRE